ncbi:MAG: ABC transporter substrate-binding protein [Clostridiales bacterium]|nr:ABC transporter substrate-binding protein [Clostridiales bacterium]
MFQRSPKWPNFFLVSSLLFCLHFQAWGGPRAGEAARVGGTLRVRPFFSGPFRPQLDPAGDSHVFIIEQLYDGLIKLDSKLNLLPSLAEYWTISEDGKRCIFYLRKGVKFHHGRELDAEDVKFSLERLVKKETAPASLQYFTSKVVGALEYWEGKAPEVEGFKVRDKYTFEILWNNPYVSGLYLLSMSFSKILPRDLVTSQGKGFFQKPSGTGPFKFGYWLRSPKLEIVGVRLERNGHYFGRMPYLDAIEFSPYYTLDHFLAKEIDIIPYMSERLSNTDCQVLENEGFTMSFLALSCHIPPLDKPSVRRAVSLAIDKKELARAAFKLDTIPRVTHNYIPPRLPGFFPADDRESYNPAEARKILAEEGFLDASDFPPLVLFFQQPRNEEAMKISRLLKDQLESLGIRLKTKYFRSATELRACEEPHLTFFDWMMDFPDPENFILPLFVSTAVVNLDLMRYSNARLDELIREAEVERSWTRRIALFQEIERILNADVPAIPLFSKQQRLAVQPYVRGMKIPALGFYFLDAKDIWLDK